jgi:3-deoxy-D-manno-octulosonic-acid transferase
MHAVYRALTAIGAPLIRTHLRRRAAEGKEDPARLGERLGHASAERPRDLVVWVHAASIGESSSVMPLVERLLEDSRLSVLITTGTVTSAETLARRLPARAVHQFVPVDIAAAVRAFHDHWRPDFALWVESELWPNLVCETAARGVPMVMVQGRISRVSWRRWRLLPGLITRLLRGFKLILAQTEDDARRFRSLGAGSVSVASTLKYAAPPLSADAGELFALQHQLGARPLWLAASTHAGEEAAVLAAHAEIGARMAGLLAVIVPRHPERGGEVAALVESKGFTVARRTAADPIGEGTEVYVADTLGELGLFYRIAPVAFVGGSLVDAGGHNPIEPIQLGAAVVSGPHLANFAEVADDLSRAEALRTVTDSHQLATAVGDLLRDPGARAELVRAQKGVTDAKADVLDEVMAAIAPYLPRRKAS